ncbi:MAG: helix-turn-helix domain-containing protein [Jatrophihabitantaceae bacterium]
MLSAVEVAGAIGVSLFEVQYPGSNAPLVQDIAIGEPVEADGAGDTDDLPDARGDPLRQQGDLVLGVGAASIAGAVELIEQSALDGASGVVLRLPLAADAAVIGAAVTTGLPLIGLRTGISWAHLVWLLRTVLDRSIGPGQLGAGDTGVHSDLFTLADAAAAILDAPVTIEDNQSRVLAYSSGQSATDPARVSTIVGRRVPADVVAHYRSSGVFRRLANSDEPFLTPPGPDGIRPRLVVPVRAGSEWLGSIWAVVGDAGGECTGQRISETVSVQLRSAAATVALHLLRLRAQADVAHLESTERLRRLLRPGPARAARGVGAGTGTDTDSGAGAALPPGPWRVVALSGGQGDSAIQLDLWRATCRRHGWAEPLLADLDQTVFALLTDSDASTDISLSGTWAWLRELIITMHRRDSTVRAAAGGLASRVTQLPRSCRQAVELHTVISRPAGEPARSVEQAWAELTLARAAATVDTGEIVGPLAVLRTHDQEHGTDYLATLAAWLRHPGQPPPAARELQVHVNTLRYRMGRLNKLVHLDLADPTCRLALQVQLVALDNTRTAI